MMKNTILIAFAILSLTGCTTKDVPLDTLVYDYEEVLTEKQRETINNLYEKFEEKTGKLIVLVTTESYGDAEDIHIYSKEFIIINELDKKSDNNYALFVFSDKNSEVKLSVGGGILKSLPVDTIRMITDSIMSPDFKVDNNYEGLLKGSEKVIEILSTENNTETDI